MLVWDSRKKTTYFSRISEIRYANRSTLVGNHAVRYQGIVPSPRAGVPMSGTDGRSLARIAASRTARPSSANGSQANAVVRSNCTSRDGANHDAQTITVI